MDHDRMSLDDLQAHQLTLMALIEAGRVLERADLKPTFDLSPGLDLSRCQKIRIRLDLIEPELGAAVVDENASVSDVMDHLVGWMAIQPAAIPEIDRDEPTPQDSSAATCSPPVATVAEESQGGATSAALAPSQIILGSPWSAEDDATAVRMRKAGATARQIAEHLGRTVAATQFRLKVKLAGLVGTTPYPSTVRSPAAPPAPSPTPAPAARVAVIAPKPTAAPAPRPIDPIAVVDLETPGWLREIRERLVAIGSPAPFTPAVDLEIVERLGRGEKGSFVATDMGIDLPALKKRHIQLLPSVDPMAQKRLLTELRDRLTGASI